MKDLTNEIRAYALQNALEYGKANEKNVLPKLFQHGLDKKDIKSVMPTITKVVAEVNAMSEEERTHAFADAKQYVKERVEQEKVLPELPGMENVKQPVFRLAPFPSGALHLGNAKTFLLNDLYAQKYNGKTILVMDDTIGSVQKPITEQGYALIEDALEYLQAQYDTKVIYKSDRIKTYYEYAEKLIEGGNAYVCHCTQEKLAENRKNASECACRHYPVDEQQKRWKAMFDAEEGSATLRIKTDMQHKNPAFRDRVLFRIADREHPRVGTTYRVWPTLEMTWAVDDHLLGMTHILRGSDLMMETEMEQYIWDLWGWDHPVIIHTGRMNIVENGKKLLSKSKAQQEVTSGEYEQGWYDPRTWSVQSLARRGITPQAIRQFVEEIGLNKQDITVPIDALYALNRKIIDEHAIRFTLIQTPQELDIQGGSVPNVELKLHPDKQETRVVKTEHVYIEQADYAKHVGKEVRLLHLCNVELKKEHAEFTSTDNKKVPKLSWTGNPADIRVLMPDGKWVEGITDIGVKDLKEGQLVQFERFGFARFDQVKDDYYEFWYAHK